MESIQDGPRNLPLKFSQDWVADIEYAVGGSGGGRWCKKSFLGPTQLRLC